MRVRVRGRVRVRVRVRAHRAADEVLGRMRQAGAS